MTASSLQEFVAKAATKRRITFGDVRRLRRDILPDGLLDRTQTELLLNLDREIPRADGAWTDWLVAAVVDFAVWGERPTGSVEGDAARWLTQVLTGGERLTKAGRRIAREVRREAQTVGEPLASLAPDEEDRPHPVENRLAA